MKRTMFTALLISLSALLAGCDTALEGPYHPYYPESAAGVLWPSPDAPPNVESAQDQPAPPAQPTTMPIGVEPASFHQTHAISPSSMPAD